MTVKDLKAAVANLKDDSEVLIDIPDLEDYEEIVTWSTDIDGDLILVTESIDFEEDDEE